MLANEVERLAGEQMRLEAHLARTDTWAEHLGTWRATVHSAEVCILRVAESHSERHDEDMILICQEHPGPSKAGWKISSSQWQVKLILFMPST